MTIRVLRLIEYRYDDIERATKDMERWTHSGSYKGMTFVSTVLPPVVVDYLERQPPKEG